MQNKPNYKVIVPAVRTRGTRLRIGKSGSIYLSKAIIRQHAEYRLGVVLMFDKETKQIALKACGDDKAEGYCAVKERSGNAYLNIGSSVVLAWQIAHQSVALEYDGEDKMYVGRLI